MTRRPSQNQHIDRGLKEAWEYYRKVQAEHVTELVLEERKRRATRQKPPNWYAGVTGPMVL